MFTIPDHKPRIYPIGGGGWSCDGHHGSAPLAAYTVWLLRGLKA